MELFDSSGRRVLIDHELFRGGEGTVHPVIGQGDSFAKLYHGAIDHRKQAKLAAMTSIAQDALVRIAAWPTATLHAGTGGRMVGFLMPRFDGQRAELHHLYTPSTRKQRFRQADLAFLIHAARNVAAAVATVHAAGHVVGDVNQRNFIVGADATVKVLDCDSFQIRGAGRIFPCEVGVPEFTPPELQNRVLANIERTPNHDAFGLAVLCFQLLFMGRHPFAGRFLGQGEMPIERAIAEGRFAFGSNGRTRQMEPPPNMVTFDSLSPRLAALFEAAFGGGATRPTAAQWSAGLDLARSELRVCSVEPMHKFYRALPHCSWCRLESASGVYFFIGVVSARAPTFDLGKLWAEIMVITALPYEPPPRPSVFVTGSAIPSGLAVQRRMARVAKVVSALLLGILVVASPNWIALMILAFAVVTVLPLPGAAERKKRQTHYRDAERAWTDAYHAAERHVSVEPLLRKRFELQRLKTTYEGLAGTRLNELAEMTQRAREIQLHHYLEQHLIRRHSIPDIGPKRKATLAAWGIDTAADVTYQSLAAVQGFGPALQIRMFAWRALLESKFVFDAKRAIPQQDLDAFEYRCRRRATELEQQLRAGAEDARRAYQVIRQRRSSIAKDLELPARQWAQARADLEIIEQAFSMKGGTA